MGLPESSKAQSNKLQALSPPVATDDNLGSKTVLLPADDALCANCGKPYMDHAARGDWCPADTNGKIFSSTQKFTPVSPSERVTE